MPEPVVPSLALLSRPGSRLLFRFAVGAVCLVVLTVVVLRYIDKASKPSRLGDTTRTAFLRWRPQVQDLFVGIDVYKVHHYPNPPIMGMVLRPFMVLPPVTGAVTWLLFKAALAVVSFVWALRLVRGDGPPIPGNIAALALLLAAHPVLGDLAHGNVNLFIGFLVFGFLELLRRRLDMAAGLTLALAVACKVTPALFLPYLVWKRAWRTLAAAVVGLALWLVVVPGAVLGFGHNVELLHSWFDEMVRPFAIEGKVTSEHANQSIPGVTVRLLTSEPSFLTYGDDGNGPPEAAAFHNFVDIGPVGAHRVVQVCQLLFVGIVVLVCRWPIRESRAGPIFAAECSLILLGMLLFSERTWKHHATTLILPMLVLLTSISAGRHRLLTGLLAAAVGLMVIPGMIGGDVANLGMVYGHYCVAFLLLTAGVVGVLVARRFS
jgi:hypothetical protein